MRKCTLKGPVQHFKTCFGSICGRTGQLLDDRTAAGGSLLRELLSIGDDKQIVAVTPIGYPEYLPRPHRALTRIEAKGNLV